MKNIFASAFVVLALFMGQSAQAQQQTGPKISTNVRQLPTNAEEVNRLEKELAQAKQNPARIADGTVAKYEAALARRKKALALENEERARLAKQNKATK